jgi:hypothetical protein
MDGEIEIGGDGDHALIPPVVVDTDAVVSLRKRFVASLMSEEDELFISSKGDLGLNLVDLDLVGVGGLLTRRESSSLSDSGRLDRRTGDSIGNRIHSIRRWNNRSCSLLIMNR